MGFLNRKFRFPILLPYVHDSSKSYRTAAKKIKIASSLLRSGFEHSDSGKHLSSVISGHGRNWGVGAVTGCYSKLIVGSNENLGIADYLIKFNSPTLKAGCLPLIRELPDNKSELILYNFSNKKNSIKLKRNNFLNNKMTLCKIITNNYKILSNLMIKKS